MVNMAKDLCAKGYKEGSVEKVGHGAGGSVPWQSLATASATKEKTK